MSSITQHVASEIFEDMQSAMVLLLFQVQLLLVASRIFAPSSVPRRLGSVRMPCEPSQLTNSPVRREKTMVRSFERPFAT